MRVYTLTADVAYEGSSFLGVFKTTKKAMKAAEEFALDNNAIFKIITEEELGLNGKRRNSKTRRLPKKR